MNRTGINKTRTIKEPTSDTGEGEGQETFFGYMEDFYRTLFCERWATWLGGLLLGFVNVMMFAYARPWGTADGMRNWGDWLLRPTGLAPVELFSPLLYTTSILNISLIVGSLTASLLATEFAFRFSPPRELLKGLVGGILMGIGANLSMGCNIGGFLSALSALSLSGLGMAVGLIIGAYLGLRYQLWDMEASSKKQRRSRIYQFPSLSSSIKGFQPYLGLIFFIISLIMVFRYDQLGYPERGGLFLFGITLGIICQRSRICFVKAFQELFIPGEAEDTRGMLLAVAIGVLGFSILKWNEFRSSTIFVYPAFWQGSIIGGVIFGIGMVLAGGCGASSLWRAGEGQVKLWMALLGFALSGSIFRTLLEATGFIGRLGRSVFLPEYLGWELTLIMVLGILFLWFILTGWNQVSRKFYLFILMLAFPALLLLTCPGIARAIDLSDINSQDGFILSALNNAQAPQDPEHPTSLEAMHIPQFDVPKLVESGSMVLTGVKLDHPMAPDHYIKSIILIDEGSLIKIKYLAHLSPQWGSVNISVPLKMARTTRLKAVVECNRHGRWLGTSPEIKVTKGGCSAAVPEPNRRLHGNIFKTRFPKTSSSDQGLRVNLTLKHPMESGLIIDDKGNPTSNFPPFFIKNLQIFNKKGLLGELELGPGLSNNPRIGFFIKSKEKGTIRFQATNNEDQTFEGTVLIRGKEERYF